MGKNNGLIAIVALELSELTLNQVRLPCTGNKGSPSSGRRLYNDREKTSVLLQVVAQLC